MTSYKEVKLPVDELGRTYMTDEMLESDPHLRRFLDRTRNSWHYDVQRSCWFLYPTVGRSGG